MNVNTAKDREAFLENVAAELSNAAYRVALQHGAGMNWLDLELDLWRIMTEKVNRLQRFAALTLDK